MFEPAPVATTASDSPYLRSAPRRTARYAVMAAHLWGTVLCLI